MGRGAWPASSSQRLSRSRLAETPDCTAELCIPKLRKGSYFPGFLESRPTVEKGAHCRDPGGPYPERLDPRRRRSAQGRGRQLGGCRCGAFLGERQFLGTICPETPAIAAARNGWGRRRP